MEHSSPPGRLSAARRPCLLALSASSALLEAKQAEPFPALLQFPLTPAMVPLFLDHHHYIRWMESRWAAGSMQTSAHPGNLRCAQRGEPPPRSSIGWRFPHRDLIQATPWCCWRSRLHRVAAVCRLDSNFQRGHDPYAPSSPQPLPELADYLTPTTWPPARASLDAELLGLRSGEPLPPAPGCAELESMQAAAIQLGLGPWLAPWPRCWTGHDRRPMTVAMRRCAGWASPTGEAA